MVPNGRLTVGILLLLFLEVAGPGPAQAQPTRNLPSFDFTQASDRQDWQTTHDIALRTNNAEGMEIEIRGTDPYLSGPSRDYPANTLLWLNLRLRSDQTGTCQVFYFTDRPTEERSVRFQVPGNEWFQTRVPLPALGQGWRLRIDPPGSSGVCVLARLWFDERVVFPSSNWPVPTAPAIPSDAFTLESGALKLRHSPAALGAFAVEVQDQRVAIGNTAARLGYAVTNTVRWLPINSASGELPRIQLTRTSLVLSVSIPDPDGGLWFLDQRFTAGAAGTLDVECSVTVDQDRQVLYLPLMTLLPGVGTHGTNKHQALFAGVEYLGNEPSSSEADVKGAAAWRQIPDTLKSTFPLMAVEAGGYYVGLIWEPRPEVGAVFDSPDRLFRSGGHLLGLVFPGSDGRNREERSLLPFDAVTLRARTPLRVHATLIGGTGSSVVPAVRQYVRLRGLPAAPKPGLSADGYVGLASHGWLDSRIRETNLFRHAYWPGFNAQPSSDAALWMLWLSTKTPDPLMAARLTNAVGGALAQVAAVNYNASQIGHIRDPVPALVFGSVLDNAAQAEAAGQALPGRFQPDGTVLYQPRPGGLDYGSTHWAGHANGLTASVVVSLLEAAAFSGDPAGIEQGLKQLRLLDQYRETVPRGAQTWEVPLHTPDILAAAHLLRAYTLGYELTGDLAFLESARYWAWAGVPFIYLYPPTSGPIGLYSTIPVLGATGWTAPVWIGLPVQWCGLVYADALYRFAGHDPDGPWRLLADGITATGILHSWPVGDADRQGLLPDVFHLRAQLRDGPAINPATVQVPALRFFRQPRLYDFRCFRRHGWRVHAPGEITEGIEHKDGIRFHVQTWSPQPCRVLVNGAWRQPRLRINGRDVVLGLPHEYLASEGRLVIRLEGSALVELLNSDAAGR